MVFGRVSVIIGPNDRLTPLAGRAVAEDFGLRGYSFRDSRTRSRVWTIDRFFLPLPRVLGGVRARVVDNKGFASFINQRDLEVSLGLANPGDYCAWLGKDYAHPSERDWIGLAMDTEDLLDDLLIREEEERQRMWEATQSALLTPGLEVDRRIHVGDNRDAVELLYLKGDYDPEDGSYPDLKLETIEARWARIERNYLSWDRT